jgi:hypothetical protein
MMWDMVAGSTPASMFSKSSRMQTKTNSVFLHRSIVRSSSSACASASSRRARSSCGVCSSDTPVVVGFRGDPPASVSNISARAAAGLLICPSSKQSPRDILGGSFCLGLPPRWAASSVSNTPPPPSIGTLCSSPDISLALSSSPCRSLTWLCGRQGSVGRLSAVPNFCYDVYCPPRPR